MNAVEKATALLATVGMLLAFGAVAALIATATTGRARAYACAMLGLLLGQVVLLVGLIVGAS